MVRRFGQWMVIAVVASLAAAACTSGGADEASPTVGASATEVAEPSASPSSVATAKQTRTATPETTTPATAEPLPEEPPRTVWLVDVETGAVQTLYQDHGPASARFDEARTQVEISTSNGVLAYDLDGSPVEPMGQITCEQDGDAAVVGGMRYDGARCGLISRTGRWMLFKVPLPEANGDWDQWVLNLETGERQLLEPGLRHCGGCDGRFGPGFSPDERFAYFSELVQDGLIYVADLVAGATEVISEGRTESDRRPIWASAGARLLYSDDGERVLLRDFDVASPVEVSPLRWPAAFDATETAIYSPAFSGREDGLSTTVVDATTLEVLLSVDGAVGFTSFWYPRTAVTRSSAGVVAAVEQAAGCAGTTVYSPSVPEGQCFESASGASVSDNGRYVALAVLLDGSTSHRFASEYEVVIVDSETLEPVVTVGGALSYDAPPVFEWDATGTRLLVTWPWALGL